MELDESYILRHLTEENVIGSGGAGKVYKVTLRNGLEVAVKKILKKKNEFEAEVETLGLIRHANILKLLCCISSADSDFDLLVLDYMQNGSLFECLHGSESMAILEWPVRQKIAVGVARGLFYLHNDCRPPILHRDVKSSNILLDPEFEAKIVDFGVAKKILSSSSVAV
jgi:serine/threonine protein kinase